MLQLALLHEDHCIDTHPLYTCISELVHTSDVEYKPIRLNRHFFLIFPFPLQIEFPCYNSYALVGFVFLVQLQWTPLDQKCTSAMPNQPHKDGHSQPMLILLE